MAGILFCLRDSSTHAIVARLTGADLKAFTDHAVANRHGPAERDVLYIDTTDDSIVPTPDGLARAIEHVNTRRTGRR